MGEVLGLEAEWYEKATPDAESGEYGVYHVRRFTDGTVVRQWIGHPDKEAG